MHSLFKPVSRISAFLAMILAVATVGFSAQTHAQKRNLRVDAATPAAPSDRKVALVIGNSEYRSAPLKNPVNDAADMARKLRSLGFEVLERPNIKAATIGRTLREFRALLTPGSVALFFYAGHGLQIKGENYLPAVDADIQGEEDVPNQSIAVRQVLDVMESARTRMNLAFLDACRNNPYARSFRSGAEGLARVSAPTGTLMSFATKPGSVAADGTGRNGLYTSELLKAIDEPNLPVELMLKRVVSGVKSASKGMQEPWMEGSIEGDFEFRVVDVPTESVVTAAMAEQQKKEAVAAALAQAARERADLQKQLDDARRRGDKPAAIAPPAPASVAAAPPALLPVAAASGNEWVYQTRDILFGKDHTVRIRSRGTDARGQALEEWLVDEEVRQRPAFNGAPVALGLPIESRFLFGSHWNFQDLPMILVKGGGLCDGRVTCELHFTRAGKEKITVPAGTVEAVRLDGKILAADPTTASAGGRVTVWLSETDRHLVRQTVRVNSPPGPRGSLDFWVEETVELVSAPGGNR